MQVPVTALGGGVAGVVMAMYRQAVKFRCESKSKTYENTPFKDCVFRNSWTGYFWAPPIMGLGVYLLQSTRSRNWFVFAIGMGFICFGILCIGVLMSSSVRIEGGRVKLIDFGREREVLDLKDILSVALDGSSFIVRMRWDRKLILSMGTQNDALLLAMLRRYRPGSGLPEQRLTT